MSEEEVTEEVVQEETVDKVLESAKVVKPKVAKKPVVPIDNHVVFREGNMVLVENLPFVIKEVHGIDIVLSRTDLK